MFRTILTLALVGAVAGVLVFAFAPVGERAEAVAALGLTLLFAVALIAPSVRLFAARHLRVIMVAGIGLCVASFGLMFAAPATSAADQGLPAQVPAFLFLGGAWLTILPFMARRMTTQFALMKAEPPPASAGFAALMEVRAAIGEVVGRKGPLLRLVGPWFLLACLAALVFVDPYWLALLHRRRDLIYAILAGALAIVLLLLLASFVAAIQWTRFAATGQEPVLTDFPGKALWGWTWRWFIYGGIFRSLDKLHPWLLVHLPAAAPWQMAGVEALIRFAAMVMFSPFALIFPAVALSAADKGITASMRGFRLVGRKYLLGAAIILAPYSAVIWALDATSGTSQSPTEAVARVVVSTLLAFTTLIVGATYATRVYLRGAPLRLGN